MSCKLLSTVTAAAIVVSALPAFAQQKPAEREEAGDIRVEEVIVVTAQKRAEDILDVPISMAAISGDKLSRSQIASLSDLQTISPNLIVDQSTDRASGYFFMRGVGTQVQDRGMEQSVGVYIDGVYRGRAGAALVDLMDIERIEVLRGPQSTLFGRNNLAGALNVVTRAPEFSFGGTGEITYGNYDALQLKTSLTGPITDKLAFRVAVQHSERDGFLENILPGQDDLDAVNGQAFRGQLFYESENTSVRLIADYNRIRDTCCGQPLYFLSDNTSGPGGLLNGYTPPGPGTPGVFPRNGQSGIYYDPFRRVVADDGPHFQNIDDWGISAELNHDFGEMTLTAIGAYRSYESFLSTDITFTDSPVLSIPVDVTNNFPEYSAELRLANSAPGTIDWIVGAYYFNQRLDEENSFLTVGGHYDARQDTHSAAIFGQATWNINEKLSATGGLRYLLERRTSITLGLTPTTLGTDGEVNQDDNAIMGTASVAYRFSDQANVYVKYSRGYLAGAINLFISTPAVQSNPSVQPTTNDSFEVGGKFRLLNNTLSVNAALFLQDIKDQQVQANIPGTVAFYVLNAAAIRSQGFELDVEYRPIDRLSFTAGVVGLDSHYTSFENAPSLFASGDLTQDLTGEPANRAPAWTITGGTTYVQPLSNADFFFTARLGFRYSTEFFTELTNDPVFQNDEMFLLDASLELGHANGWSIQAWSKNVTDHDYIRTGGTSFDESHNFFLANPRTYGLSARIRF